MTTRARFFHNLGSTALPEGVRAVERIRRKDLDKKMAEDVAGMDIPTFRLHALKGDLKGFFSVTVRANRRIVFRFEDGNAFDVDFVDYH